MENLSYSPEVSQCDFFLFGFVKEQLKRRSFTEEEALLSVLSKLMSGIPPVMILRSLPTGIEGYGFVF
jgi:hypothetical protein